MVEHACFPSLHRGFLGNHLRLEKFQQIHLPRLPSLFHYYIESIEEGVECRVERQHEDCHGHVDLPSDRNTGRRQQTQYTDGEPTDKVGHDDGDQTTGDDQVLRLSGRVRRHEVGLDGKVDDALSRSDEQKEDEVEDDDDGEGVRPSLEALPGDGKGDTNAALAVKPPV